MCDVRYSVVHPMGTWVVIVAGWIVVHFLTVTRERQKEIRDLKSRLVERILEIEKRSIDFHQAEIYSLENGSWIIAEIHRASKSLSRQPLSSLGVKPEVVKKFRQSITGRNFDLSSFVPQRSASDLVRAISACAEDLSEDVERAYASKYLTSWWQIFRV